MAKSNVLLLCCGLLFGCASDDSPSVESADGAVGEGDPSGPSDTPLADEAIDSIELMLGADPSTVCFPKQGRALPLALMLQGANVERRFYEGLCRRVAAYGFVVAIPDHRNVLFNGLFPEASQVAAARSAFGALADDESSALRGVVDSQRLILLGHSFGATTALPIAEGIRDVPFVGTPKPVEGLRGVVVFAAGGQTRTLAHGKVPVAMINGALDTKSTPDEALATYEALSGDRKVLVVLDGMQHYGICDEDNPEGAAAETVLPALTQQQSVRKVSDVIGKLARAFAFEDEAAWKDITIALPRDDAGAQVMFEP